VGFFAVNRGLGDRLRALPGAAILALATGRRLQIDPSLLQAVAVKPPSKLIHVLDAVNCGRQYILAAAADDVSLNTNCGMAPEVADEIFATFNASMDSDARQGMVELIDTCAGLLNVGQAANTGVGGSPLPLSQCTGLSSAGCFPVSKAYRCGPMMLHIAAYFSMPSILGLLQSVSGLHQAWRRTMAPKGYNALHMRTGHAKLHLAEHFALPSTPWQDPDWCGSRCDAWLNAAAAAKRSPDSLPLVIASDSSRLVGELQSRLWESLPILHCCSGPVHIAREGGFSEEKQLSVIAQTFIDLVLLGHAQRLFVGKGRFWTLALFWWDLALPDLQVHYDAGPKGTLPLLV
jgi:hypothetical protein